MLQVPTYAFRFNIILFLTSHKPCGLWTGKGPEGYASSHRIKWHSYIVEFMLRILMKVSPPQIIIFTTILTRSPHWNGQNSWFFMRANLMILLLVHSVPNSPFYKYSQKASSGRWDHTTPHPQPAEGVPPCSEHVLAQERVVYEGIEHGWPKKAIQWKKCKE